MTGIYNYLTSVNISGDMQPVNTHLVFELASGNLIFVSNADDTEVWHLTTSTGATTQLDVDPSDTSGDTNSRDHTIQAAWHDRDNSIIYFIDCDNPGDDFDVWTLDYSASETSPTITEVGTSSTYDTDTVYAHDIIRYDSNTYAFVSYYDSAVPTSDLFDVSSSPFSVQKTLNTEHYKYGFYFVVDESATIIYTFIFDIFTYILSRTIDTDHSNSVAGLEYDGSHYFLVDRVNAEVFEYNDATFGTASTEHVLHGDNGAPRGICHDGTYFYVVDNTDNRIYKYNDSFTLQTSYNLNASNTNPYGICWDGTYFYVADTTDGSVYYYDSSFTYQGVYDISSILSSPLGITWDDFNSYFVLTEDSSYWKYVFDSSFNFVRKFYSNEEASYGLESTGIVWDGLNYYCSTVHPTLSFKGKIYKFNKVIEVEYNFSTDTVSTNDVSTTTIIPTIKNRLGIAYDNDDILYYTLQKVSDSKYYLQSYTISTATNEEIGEYNVTLMLDRNTDDANDAPFNLEKGFGVDTDNKLMVYQIPRTYNGRLNKIADLTNNSTYSGYEVVAITDSYLFLYNSTSGDTVVLTFESVDSSIFDSMITHRVRDYPWAWFVYDSDTLHITENMFVQIIGTYTSAGTATSNEVLFEGYVVSVEDEVEESSKVKRAELVSPAFFDLSLNFPSYSISGDTDAHITAHLAKDIIGYLTEGTLSDGANLNSGSSITYRGGNSLGMLLTHYGVFDEFQWYATPKGETQYNSGAVDSQVDYTQEDNAHYCRVSERELRYNKIKVFGSRASGTQIESDGFAEDEELQKSSGVKTLEITIPWINLEADADTMAASLLSLLGSALTHIEIDVRDPTNGFIQPGEEITFESSAKSITSAQFKIIQTEYNYKTDIATYILCSGLRYDLEDLKEKDVESLEEQVAQLSSYTENQFDTATGHDHDGANSKQVSHDDLTGVSVNDHIDNLTDIPTRSHTDLSSIGSNTHSEIDSHISSESNPHSVTLDEAYDEGRSIDGATSWATSVSIGSASGYLQLMHNGDYGYIGTSDNVSIRLDENINLMNNILYNPKTIRQLGLTPADASDYLLLDVKNDNNKQDGLRFNVIDNNSYPWILVGVDSGNKKGYFGAEPDGISIKKRGWYAIISNHYWATSKFPSKTVLNRIMSIRDESHKGNRGELDHLSLCKDLRPQDPDGTELTEIKDGIEQPMGHSLNMQCAYNTRGIQEMFNLLQGAKNEIDELKARIAELEAERK